MFRVKSLSRQSRFWAIFLPTLCVIFSQFNTARADIVRGVELIDEPIQLNRGTFVLPNEYESWHFASSLQDKTGALISVGTFRSLTDLAYGSFSEAYLLDYDNGVVTFNRINLEMIKAARDRTDYLESFFGHHLTMQEKADIKQDPAREMDIWRQIASRKTLLTPPWVESLLQTDHPLVRGPQGMSNVKRFTAILDQSELSGSGGIMSSDFAFSRIQAMARAGNIHVVNGSLNGSSSVDSIARALRAGKIKASVVDISNSMDYILRPLGASPNEVENIGRANADALRKNLQKLPMSKNATLLLTSDSVFPDNDPLPWGYFAIPMKQWLESTSKPSFSAENYQKLLSEIKDTGMGLKMSRDAALLCVVQSLHTRLEHQGP
jgi:hypothetical protein